MPDPVRRSTRRCTDLRGLMDQHNELSRRGALKAGVGGLAGGALPLPSEQAPASSVSTSADSAAALSAPATTFEFTAGTNAFVTASPVGDQLIAGVQGVLWSIPRTGGPATALTPADLEPTRVAWSPDGSRIAVCAYQGGGFHVWTMAPDGFRQRQLTSGPWDDRGVAWSPDGSRIAFASERGGDPVAGSSYSVWTVDVRSGELAQLTDDPDVEDYDPAWHPDGIRLVFVRAGAKGGRTLASVPAGGGEVSVARTVDKGTLVGPAVSTDGRVAYVQVGDFVQPFNAASSVLMVDGEPVTDGEDVSPFPPCWTPKGELFYVAEGQVKVRRPGTAQSTPEQIPFTASLSVSAATPQETLRLRLVDPSRGAGNPPVLRWPARQWPARTPELVARR
ncbi:hypothetical protein [Streptomyces sp. SA15]|uniref:TolB family protein n=1 Tax=Streptomyces sp. SA15 TaxID=934019 RepID=UPI001C530E9B|nr:hypothetical protein [Streptomyces sp. SA15]